MRVTQQNFGRLGLIAALSGLLLGLSPGASTGSAGRITPRGNTYDPILSGPPEGPCAALLASPDYVAGMDAYGYPVAPADLPDNTRAHALSDVVLPEIATHNIGRVDVPVVVPGLAEATNGPPTCSVRHRHPKN